VSGLRTCFHCGSPLTESATKCPQCQTALGNGLSAAQAGHGGRVVGLEQYEIPFFDLPLAFELILDPTKAGSAECETVVKKYAMRSFILSFVGALLTFSPMIFFGALPAALGLVWSIMALRVARYGKVRAGRWSAAGGFGLGLLACVNVVLALLLSS
jgi:hypothetical protein